MKLKALDLFSGIGGFSLGLDRAGVETVAFCEIDPACKAVLNHHWPKIPVLGDIREIGISGDDQGIDLGFSSKINIICGGYPCTGHSVAGKKKGFENEGSALWKEYLRLTNQIKPRYCIIENSHNLRSTGLAEILKAFDEVGYDAEWSIISAYSIGSPHQRERLYIVFWRKDIPYPDSFRYWQADPKKAESSQGWWSKRRFKRNPVFGKIPQAGSGVLQLTDGVSQRLVKVEEYKIAMLGNALMPQIPELIGKALVEHEESLNE